MNWQKNLKGKIKPGEPLKRHTTFKIGGPAEFFIKPKGISDLKLLLKGLKSDKIPILVIGAGSNILAADKGIKAAVLKLNAPDFRKVSFRGNYLNAGSGLMLQQLLSLAVKRGLSGMEFLAGIPGTLGGALVMNAGAWGRDIASLVREVKVMDYYGRAKTLKRKEIKFSYRKSGLDKYIILSACLKLIPAKQKEIRDNINKYLELRRNTQDTGLANAGCIFKNPQAGSAGRLIDLCGLKGKRMGGARISLKHANFILNKGNARSRDVLGLMRLMRKTVKQKFKVSLEPEIKIWN